MQFRRRQPLDFRVEISPLIDVVFLLLIFFMVSSTFIEEAALEIDLPESRSTTEAPEAPLELLVKPGGSMLLEERDVTLEELEGALSRAVRENPGRPLWVKADERVLHGTMVKIYDACRAAEVPGFTIDAKPVEEPVDRGGGGS